MLDETFLKIKHQKKNSKIAWGKKNPIVTLLPGILKIEKII